MIKFIKHIWNQFIETLLALYDKFTYPMEAKSTSHFEIYFRPEGIFFQDYTFVAASVYPSGLISYTHIQEVLLHARPPEIRTKNGEVLFVLTSFKELEAAALTNQIPLVSRVDVWSYILEPFLEKQVSSKEEENTLRRLEDNNISRQECQKIRDFVKEAIVAYNLTGGLWGWNHLGLCDVLVAFSGVLSGHRHKLSETDFKNFYYQAMEIANRSKLIEQS